MVDAKDITYTISVNDLIEAIKEYNGAKIEFYKDGNFAIMGILDDGSPTESIYNEYVYASDFYEDEDGDVEKFANWLRHYWRDGFPAFKIFNCDHIAHINWVE